MTLTFSSSNKVTIETHKKRWRRKKEERGRKGILYAHRENIIESAAGAPGLAITLSNCFL